MQGRRFWSSTTGLLLSLAGKNPQTGKKHSQHAHQRILAQGSELSNFGFPSLTSYFDGGKLFIISSQLTFATLGQAWINLVRLTLEAGTQMGPEGFERLGVEVAFPAEFSNDSILNRFGDAQMIANMEKVFFGEGTNPLGHSYAGLMHGPGGRTDLQDITDLLRHEPWSKRAVLTLSGVGNGKVPCINAVQFLIRNEALQVIYFARGQDAFRKFYADALCIASMARKVSSSMQIPPGTVTGFIGSCHIYHKDLPSIRRMLEATKNEQSPPERAKRLRHGDGSVHTTASGQKGFEARM